MLSKSTIKDIKALRQKKYRQKYHKIVVEGTKSVVDVLREDLVKPEALYATESWLSGHSDLLEARQKLVSIAESEELSAISSLTTPQEALLVCTMPEHKLSAEVMASELCLYLDGIRDPGNVGTIFRIADWFGIKSLFLSPDTADPYNPKVIQASMASLFRTHWMEIDLVSLLHENSSPVYVTAMDGEDIYKADLSTSGLIILGNESTGVRLPSNQQLQRLAIPRHLALGADSLNVAIAAGIVCSEFRRRVV